MKKAVTMILQMLGLQKFEMKDGKPALSSDQRSKVLATFGEEFTTKFEKYLSESEGDESEADGATALMSAFQAMQTTANANMQAQLDAVIAQNKKLEGQIETLANSPEEDAIPEMDKTIPRQAEMPTIMKVDMRKPHYAEVAHFLKTGRMKAAEAATIEISDLKDEFGTYLSQGRNNLDEVETIFQGFSSSGLFTPKMGTTEWRAKQALITSVSQQFTPKWTPSGKSKFRPLTIKNYRHKINVSIVPADVLESYLFDMYNEQMAPDQMPITKYIINRLVLPQLQQDNETRMVWKGKYVEQPWDGVSTGDAGTAPEDSMDGIETFLVDNKAANAARVQYHDVGAFDYKTATAQEVLDYVQDYVDWIAPLFKSRNMPIGCSDEFYRVYKRAYKKVNGAGSDKADQTNYGSDTIDFSRQFLQPIDGMYGSPILFTTPKANMIKLRHKNEVPKIINDIQLQDYEAKVFGEYWLGVGFAYGEAVFASVPDGYDPKAQIIKSFGASTEYQQNRIAGSGSASGGI